MREQAGAPVVPDAPAPAMAAVNEAPPEDVAWFLQSEFGQDPSQPVASSSYGVCEVTGSSGLGFPTAQEDAGNSCPQPTAEEQAQWAADEQRYEEAIRPAAGSVPRVIARLPLRGGGSDLLFTAWKSSSGELCWETDESGPEGGGGGGPSGPCAQQAADEAYPELTVGLRENIPPCDVICLGSDGGNSGDGADTYLLSGTVPVDAEAIRVTVDGGTTATYPLLGPRVLDTERSVFMLDLGARDWRKLELIRGGAIVATAEMPKLTAAYEDCSSKVGPLPDPPASADMQAMLDAMQPYQAALTECVRASGALPSPGLPASHFP